MLSKFHYCIYYTSALEVSFADGKKVLIRKDFKNISCPNALYLILGFTIIAFYFWERYEVAIAQVIKKDIIMTKKACASFPFSKEFIYNKYWSAKIKPFNALCSRPTFAADRSVFTIPDWVNSRRDVSHSMTDRLQQRFICFIYQSSGNPLVKLSRAWRGRFLPRPVISAIVCLERGQR